MVEKASSERICVESSLKEIEAKNYNLDFKNPHFVDEVHLDPEKLMIQYEDISKKLNETRELLKRELMLAIGSH